jgi:hypothetical protein
VIYRVDRGGVNRDPGRIVGVARITSSPWSSYRAAYTGVNWEFQPLPLEDHIPSVEMKQSGLWKRKVPFSSKSQAAGLSGWRRTCGVGSLAGCRLRRLSG